MVTCAFGVPCYDNEMGHQVAYNGVVVVNCGPGPPCIGGPFPNVAFDYYWSGTDTANGLGAWTFYFPLNEKAAFSKSSPFGLFVWPVLDGDIGVVPIPAAA